MLPPLLLQVLEMRDLSARLSLFSPPRQRLGTTRKRVHARVSRSGPPGRPLHYVNSPPRRVLPFCLCTRRRLAAHPLRPTCGNSAKAAPRRNNDVPSSSPRGILESIDCPRSGSRITRGCDGIRERVLALVSSSHLLHETLNQLVGGA